MKKTLITACALGVAFTSFSAFADSKDDVSMPYPPEISRVENVTEREERSVSVTNNTRIKAQGDRLIRERIATLNSTKKIFDDNKSLTPEQKASLSATITTNVAGLTSLRSTLATSTSATSSRILVKSIYTDFRIYGIVIPQVRLEKRVYDLMNHSQKLSDRFLLAQDKINKAKEKGYDVTQWQKSLDEAKISVATDMNTLVQLRTQVKALTPADYGTSSKATIESVNQSIRSISKNFNSIAKTLRRPAYMSKSGTATSTRTIVATTTAVTSTTTTPVIR